MMPIETTTRRGDTRIELLRVIGALSVFSYHFMGDVETVFRPSLVHGALWTAAQNVLGYFGVSLFIVISGQVFTWAWSRTDSSAAFVRSRLAALFPLYWWIAVPLIAVALYTHRMPITDLSKVPFWLSGLGILSPATFFPVVSGWWYMTLALQLALTYPLLRWMQERLGVKVFMLLSAVLTVLSVYWIRALGLEYAIQGFVGCRLLEFALGMTIGIRMRAGARGWIQQGDLAAALVAVAVCAGASTGDLLRITLAPAVVLLTVGIARNPSGRFGRWASVGGTLSFAFYLSHSPWAKPILASVAGWGSPALVAVLGGAMSLMVAIMIALGFQTSFVRVSHRLGLVYRIKSTLYKALISE